VDEVLYQLQKDGSRFDKYFPDWIPHSMASSICSVPHPEQGDSVLFLLEVVVFGIPKETKKQIGIS